MESLLEMNIVGPNNTFVQNQIENKNVTNAIDRRVSHSRILYIYFIVCLATVLPFIIEFD